jgi:hypothetical protein
MELRSRWAHTPPPSPPPPSLCWSMSIPSPSVRCHLSPSLHEIGPHPSMRQGASWSCGAGGGGQDRTYVCAVVRALAWLVRDRRICPCLCETKGLRSLIELRSRCTQLRPPPPSSESLIRVPHPVLARGKHLRRPPRRNGGPGAGPGAGGGATEDGLEAERERLRRAAAELEVRERELRRQVRRTRARRHRFCACVRVCVGVRVCVFVCTCVCARALRCAAARASSCSGMARCVCVRRRGRRPSLPPPPPLTKLSFA